MARTRTKLGPGLGIEVIIGTYTCWKTFEANCLTANNIFIGFVTNGEWNSIRMKGNTRPLSVLQIRAEVRKKYATIGVKKLEGMLTPKCKLGHKCFSICFRLYFYDFSLC